MIGTRQGTWLVTGGSVKRAKGGGLFFCVRCEVCGHTEEKDGQLLKRRPPGCQECRRNAPKPEKLPPRSKRLLILAEPPILVENLSFHSWVLRQQQSVIAHLTTLDVKVYEGSTLGMGLATPNPWQEAKRLLGESLPVEPVTLTPTGIMQADDNLPPPAQEYLLIQKEHEKFFNADAYNGETPPGYIAAWAVSTPGIEDMEFRFLPARNGFVYVVWEKIVHKSEAAPDFDIPIDIED